jgi:hypothetical protein
MHKRGIVMALAASCGVATIMVGTLGAASGDEGASARFTVTSGITSEADAVTAFSPDYTRCGAGFPCVVPVTPEAAAQPHPGAFDDAISGDIVGSGSFRNSFILSAANDLGVPNPATVDFPFDRYEPFSGTVEGCGSGTLILHDQGNLNSNSGQWWIVPGSGRGDLVGISGSGSYSSPAPFTPTAYIGHIRCAK